MTPKDFKAKYFTEAKNSEYTTGIDAYFTLAQAAVESGWGEHAPGFAFFGIKDTDGINGNEQLITTTEYSKRSDLKFERLLHMEPVEIKGEKFFRYTIQSYFRKYNSAEESFKDHARFFLENSRYAQALLHKSDPDAFTDAIAAAGYATGPNYASTIKSIIHSLKNI
ncbi:MAG TPA: glycoside hydrolase family 73 protein [Candidatus Wunengus sp. YC60]|uniref:glycoside hydrolase family 73 protein n=1 Tax=Candidatus Wunengus sp. YC60 TaxID=3367697 RepID=UPI0040293243